MLVSDYAAPGCAWVLCLIASADLSAIVFHLGKKATARRAAINRDLARLDVDHGTQLSP